MSAILEGTPDKRLALVTGRAYPEQAEETAKYLGTTVLETTAYDFANGEMYIRFTEPVRGADVFVMQSHTRQPAIRSWVTGCLYIGYGCNAATPDHIRQTGSRNRTGHIEATEKGGTCRRFSKAHRISDWRW